MIPIRTAIALLLTGGIIATLAVTMTSPEMNLDRKLGLLASLIVLDLALIGFDARGERRR